jgi:hypothetical protein
MDYFYAVFTFDLAGNYSALNPGGMDHAIPAAVGADTTLRGFQ